MDNTNFSLNDLDELIASAEKKKSNDDKMKQFAEIIDGVARKYFSFGKEGAMYLSQEDAAQELWVRILELIRDCGGVENTDADLVARIAYNKAVDLFRFYRRRRQNDIPDTDGIEGNRDDVDYFEALYSEKFLKGYDLVLIKEVIDLFEIGSKERKYAVMKLVNAGVLSPNVLDPWDKALVEVPETEDEEGYIHCLGYKSHCPGSWTVKKRAMYSAIIAFLEM